MKRKLFILLISVLGISLSAKAYDFSSMINGQTLYFNITSNISPYSVEVTSEITSGTFYITQPTGAILIPDTISYNQNIYSVTSIGNHAFNECSDITSITIPNSVTSIGDYAFYFCIGLTSITLPNSITSIGNYAFAYCPALSSMSIPSYISTIGQAAFYNCSSLISITLPNSLNSIGSSAFEKCRLLTSITIPNSITQIGIAVFASCDALTSVTIPNSITSIGDYAFAYCPALSSLTLPNSITSIGSSAFAGCFNITSIIIPNSVTSIGNDAFFNCIGLTSVTIPNSIDSISNMLFGNCIGLTSIVLPNSITSIGDHAFSACHNLISILIPNSVTSIGSSAFVDCNALTSISLPNTINEIKYSTFAGCNNLTSITLPNSLISIDDYGFLDCNSLITITLFNNLTTIGDYAFSGCSALSSIIAKPITPPIIQSNSFNGVLKTIPIYIPYLSAQNYQTSTYWSDFTNYQYLATSHIINASFCQGDTYTNYGANIDSAGTYFLIYNNDSIHLNLVLNPTYKDTINAEICQGTTYTLYGFNESIAGTYTQNLQTINGCDSIITLNLIVNQVTTPTNLSLQNNQNHFELTWQSDAESYTIYRNNILVFSTTNTIFIDTNVIDGTNYCYKVKASEGDCEAESSEICQVFTGLNEIIDNPIKINLYPNPTSSSSRLEIENVEGKVEITITDISGRKIQRMIARANNKLETTIDLSNHSKGIYFISIVTEKTKRTEKLILK